MTPEQALMLIDKVISQVSAPRAVHEQLQEALRVLAAAVKK